MFSLRYLVKSGALFARYPATLPKLIDGLGVASSHLNAKINDDYRRRPKLIARSNGVAICLDPSDRVHSPAFAMGCHEPEVTELFRRLLRKGMTVVDAGAHWGWYACLAARIVGKTGRVLAFEPEPQNFSLLSKSVQVNEFKNVFSFNEALGDRDGTITLSMGLENLGSHSTVRMLDGRSINVSITRLDNKLSQLGIDKVDLLKVDVEGGEPEVILGCGEYLSGIPNIIIEYNPITWGANKQSLFRVLDGYEMYGEVRSPFLFKKVDVATLDSGFQAANLYFRKRGRRQQSSSSTIGGL